MAESKEIANKLNQQKEIVFNNTNSSEQNKAPTKVEYNFDKLKMFFGEPFTIECEDTNNITIYQPTIGNILEFGEQAFYSMLNTFISNTTSYRLQLWDMGIDWNKITDYQLFCMLVSEMKKDATSLLFGDIDFQLFKLNTKQVDNEQTITLYNKEQNIEISESTYKCIAEYLRMMFNIYPKVEKAKGKSTKEAIIDEDRMNLNNNKGKHYDSTLLPLISSCINHPGFKYSLSELREVGIVQFMDSVQRLQIYENTVALMSGMYSGMVDIKGLPSDALNFMRSINEK